MKARREDYILQSVVCVGTLALLSLEENSERRQEIPAPRSPFNAASILRYPFLSEEETYLLFTDFATRRREVLNPTIVSHIFIYTRGHRGLTCLLGKILDEDFRQMCGGILPNVLQWTGLHRKIPHIVSNYKTMGKMIAALQEQTPKAIQARKILTSLITYGSDTKYQPRPEDHAVIHWLSYDGAIISTEPDIWQISSPLVRLIILHKVLPVDRRKVPPEPVPRTSENLLDVSEMIFKALHYIIPEHIRTAYQISFKKNQGKGLERGVQVPSEAVYHFEIYTILALWLPGEIHVHPEANVYHNPSNRSEARMRDDILITEKDTKYLIEFEASDSKTEITKHALDLEDHMIAIGASQAWLLYFSTVDNFTWPTYQNANCHNLAVVHTYDCGEVSFWDVNKKHKVLRPYAYISNL